MKVKKEPLVSVIMAVFNGAKTLQTALQSVENQSYKNIEVLLIDDGSTDNTSQVAEQFSFVKYYYQKNQGLTAAHNAGLQQASGEYLTFLDHDDEYTPEKITQQIACFQADPNLLLVRSLVKNVYLSDENKWSDEGYYNAEEKTKYNTNLGSMLIKKTVFDRLGPFDNRLKICADFDFWNRVQFYEIPYENFPEVALKYHLHDDNLILDEQNRKREFIRVYKYHIDRTRQKKKEEEKYPKISCLTVTKGRLTLLKRAIYCFNEQTYPNKELVIVTDTKTEGIEQIKTLVTDLNTAAIFVHCDDLSAKLGHLRNLSISAATGPIFCQWDDDDEYHPERLMTQFQYLQSERADVCFMSDQLQVIKGKKLLAWSNWHRTINNAEHGVIPGTIMMYKDPNLRYPPHVSKAEDTFFIYTLLAKRKKIAVLRKKGYLYLYQHHGANTWDLEAHEQLLNRAATSLTFAQPLLAELESALNFFELSNDYIYQTNAEQIPLSQVLNYELC